MNVFIHIPKTGGTSVVDILDRQIFFGKFKRLNPTRDTHPKVFLANATNLLAKVLSQSRHKVVGGHFAFGSHPELMDPSKYFTVLRNPVERVISEYFYMKQKGFFYQSLIKTENLDLIDYLHHPETSYLNNLQSRLISGVSYDEGDEVTSDILNLAIDNMLSFAAIGLTEKMPETLALFQSRLSWPRTPFYTHANINDQRPELALIDKSTIEAIMEREKFDLKLYQRASSLFERSVNLKKDDVQQSLDRIMARRPLERLLTKAENKLNRFLA